MKTKFVMMASSGVLGAAGVAASFLPEEILSRTTLPPEPVLVIGLQILGALYLGFALINWFARDTVIGGIYSKPLSLGNFGHFMIGALVLGKALTAGPASMELWAASLLYGTFALLFGYIMFTHPVKT